MDKLRYQVELRRAGQRELDALPEDDYTAVAEVISALQEDPRPPRVKKLADSGLWRIRVGRYRIVFTIDDEARLVTVVRVARRREDTYRRL